MTRGLLLALALAGAVWAQVAVPPLTARVTDRTATLTGEQKAAMEKMLQEFEARKGAQIAVLLVETTAPETIEQYALRVAEQWKIGRARVDDGAILVVAKTDRALRIEVGYGLEGALNDATAKRIVSDIVVPRFREGDFFGGLSAGLDRMMRVIDGEPLPAAAKSPPAGESIQQLVPILLLLALFVGVALRAMLGRLPGALAAGGTVGVLAWLLAGTVVIGLIAGLAAFLFTLLGGGPGGHRHYGGFPGGLGRHGGFGRGGGLGGGFRGGGGGFGGGGASGRW